MSSVSFFLFAYSYLEKTLRIKICFFCYLSVIVVKSIESNLIFLISHIRFTNKWFRLYVCGRIYRVSRSLSKKKKGFFLFDKIFDRVRSTCARQIRDRYAIDMRQIRDIIIDIYIWGVSDFPPRRSARRPRVAVRHFRSPSRPAPRPSRSLRIKIRTGRRRTTKCTFAAQSRCRHRKPSDPRPATDWKPLAFVLFSQYSIVSAVVPYRSVDRISDTSSEPFHRETFRVRPDDTPPMIQGLAASDTDQKFTVSSK